MSGTAVSVLFGIVVAVFSLALIGTLLGRYIYRLHHGQATGDCLACQGKGKRLVSSYHRKYRHNH